MTVAEREKVCGKVAEGCGEKKEDSAGDVGGETRTMTPSSPSPPASHPASVATHETVNDPRTRCLVNQASHIGSRAKSIPELDTTCNS